MSKPYRPDYIGVVILGAIGMFCLLMMYGLAA